jgi:hypothetical protein
MTERDLNLRFIHLHPWGWAIYDTQSGIFSLITIPGPYPEQYAREDNARRKARGATTRIVWLAKPPAGTLTRWLARFGVVPNQCHHVRLFRSLTWALCLEAYLPIHDPDHPANQDVVAQEIANGGTWGRELEKNRRDRKPRFYPKGETT